MTRRKSPHDLDTFHAHLDALKLFFIREHYPDVVRCAAEEQSDHLTVLERLIEGEANLRRDRSIERRIRLARFPVKKTLDSFDWSWPNKIQPPPGPEPLPPALPRRRRQRRARRRRRARQVPSGHRSGPASVRAWLLRAVHQRH